MKTTTHQERTSRRAALRGESAPASAAPAAAAPASAAPPSAAPPSAAHGEPAAPRELSFDAPLVGFSAAELPPAAETPLAPPAPFRRTAAYRTPILERVLSLVAMDVLCAVAALSSAFAVWAHLSAEGGLSAAAELLALKWHWLPTVGGAWIAACWVSDLYDATTGGIKTVLIQRTLVAMVVALSLCFTLYFFFPDFIPRTFSLMSVAIAAGLGISARVVQHAFCEKRLREHRLMLVGDRWAAEELDSLFGKIRCMKMRLVAYSGEDQFAGMLLDNGRAGLLRYAIASDIDEIVVSSEPNNESDEIYRALVECQSNGIRVSSMAEIYRKLSRQIPVKYVNSNWVLTALQDRLLFTRIQLGIKRAFDIAGAVLAMPVLLLLLPWVALAIKLNSPGPIFYRQIRAGRAGRKFWILKFRTMSADAEQDGKARWCADNDPRITAVGAILRKTRIDELPQFINVLKGDMSLVGPRPERPEIEQHLDDQLPHYFIRRLVKPGITGWAQVHYKYGNCLEDSLRKLQYDAYYVRYWSVAMDIYTMLRTVGVVVARQGQ